MCVTISEVPCVVKISTDDIRDWLTFLGLVPLGLNPLIGSHHMALAESSVALMTPISNRKAGMSFQRELTVCYSLK